MQKRGLYKKLNGIIPIEYTFVKGIKSSFPSLPLTEKLLETLGSSFNSHETDNIPYKGHYIPPERIRAVEEYLVELIGPIASIIMDNIFSDISYARENPMRSEDYTYLLNSMEKELSENQKVALRTRYGVL
ncbi:MAG: hypothetical protein QMD01_05695 [Thermodesulfovibrionales bacterium]|nr:hypothetical protein [Thermodesulfovibrionales bacterium]